MKKNRLLLKLGIVAAVCLLCCVLFAIAAGAESDPVNLIADDVSIATELLRDEMVNRTEAVKITIPLPDDLSEAEVNALVTDQYNQIMAHVFDHTGNGNEGDYLERHFDYISWNGATSYTSEGAFALHTFLPEYYTDANEEGALTDKLAEIYDSLDLDGKSSDYEKFDAIYDWIVKHVVYDYTNLNNESYKLKYTAYAAAVNGTSVCQGYANLLYRMLLDAGVDCRIITGGAASGIYLEPHAWNIVRLGDYYYYVDATWDSGAVYEYPTTGTEFPMFYRLRGDNTGSKFDDDHFPADDFKTAEFLDAYPLSDKDYAVPFFSGHSVTLDGLIGINFMVKFDGLTAEQMQAAYVTFTVNGRITEVPYSESTLNASETARKFSVYINSIEMADRITAVLSCDGKTFTQTYSLTDYLDYIDTHADQFSDEVKAVCDSLRDLGHYTQVYLSELHGWKIGKDHLSIAARNELSKDTGPYNEAKAIFGEQHAITIDTRSNNIDEISVSLVTEAGTGINIYIKPNESFEGDFYVNVDGIDGKYVKVESINERDDGRLAVMISGIPADKLDQYFTVNVHSYGEDFQAQMSVLRYAKIIFNGDFSDSHKAAAMALALYFKAVQYYMFSL